MIEQRSKVPLYHQLYRLLYDQIKNGRWRPGDGFPTETELIAQFGLSRGTVRQALDALVDDGLIHRQRGRGSFVAPPAIEQVAGQMVTFTEDMRRRGLLPSTQVLAAELVPAPEALAARLKTPPGQELARLERLRLADGEPMSLEEAFLVHRLCPGVLGHDYARESLRAVLAEEHDIYQVRGEQTVRAVPAAAEVARALGIRSGAALLFIERVSYSQRSQPVEFLRLYHRGDRYALQNELVGWSPE